jgi:hypothetical protein
MHPGVGHKKQGSSTLQDFASGYLEGEQLLKSHVAMAKREHGNNAPRAK